MAKILIADDNRQITSILEEYVKKEGHQTVIAFDGEHALQLVETEKPELLLLDVMMPKMDGFEVCRQIRKTSNVPIIMVTARGEDFERIMGLEIGADDYIVKPFSPAEVMARIKAILRRMIHSDAGNHGTEQKNCFMYDNLKVDIDDYKVWINDKTLALTKKEIEIMWTLVNGKNRVFSRDNLLDEVWGYDYFGDSRTVDSHIKRLRAKIDEYSHPRWDIKTIWGIGYKFEIIKEG